MSSTASLHPNLFLEKGMKLHWRSSSASAAEEPVVEAEPKSYGRASRHSCDCKVRFNHSADYRAVMAFVSAYLFTDPREKRLALVAMVDRFFPASTAA